MNNQGKIRTSPESTNVFNGCVIATIIVLGLVNLPQPFDGDQALNTMIAENLVNGGTLYFDIWDLKQPGIFVYLSVAGLLFGFTEIGIHSFELLWNLAFAVVLLATLRRSFSHPWMPGLAVFLTVGVYYITTGVWHQTQTETLVGFPLFLTLWSASQAVNSPRWRSGWSAISGLLGGVVAVFKIALLPIVGCFWLLAYLRLAALEPDMKARNLARTAAPVGAGLAVPTIGCLLYFFNAGTVELVEWTFFDYPFQLMAVMTPKLRTLLGGLNWFISTFAPLFPLAAVGAMVSIRKDFEVNALGWISWVFVGLLAVLLQRISWWQYHYYTVSVPLGLLATKGVEALVQLDKSEIRLHGFTTLRRFAAAMLVALFLPMAWTFSVKAGILGIRGFAISTQSRLAFRATMNQQYKLILEDLSYLKQVKATESVFFVGDPLYYFLSRRQPETRFPLGWSVPLESQYKAIEGRLKTNPPQHIFLRRGVFDELRALTPAIERPIRDLESSITETYEKVEDFPRGTWLVLRHTSSDSSN